MLKCAVSFTVGNITLVASRPLALPTYIGK